MWLPCDHDLGITLLSSHAKETKYSNDVLPQSPSRTSRVYIDVLEDCDSGLISFFLERGTGKLRVQCDHSGLGARVFKLGYYPRFSIARSCEDLVKADEQLMGLDKGNPEQRRSYL